MCTTTTAVRFKRIIAFRARSVWHVFMSLCRATSSNTEIQPHAKVQTAYPFIRLCPRDKAGKKRNPRPIAFCRTRVVRTERLFSMVNSETFRAARWPPVEDFRPAAVRGNEAAYIFFQFHNGSHVFPTFVLLYCLGHHARLMNPSTDLYSPNLHTYTPRYSLNQWRTFKNFLGVQNFLIKCNERFNILIYSNFFYLFC